MEKWCPFRALEKEAPETKAWAYRHLSMHQVLRLSLPISGLTESPEKVGFQVTLARKAISYTFLPHLPVWAVFRYGQRDPGL